MFEYNCKIVRIVDGDTIDVDIDLGFGLWIHKERIRLYGIDTPESRTRDLVEKKYGLFAKKYVETYLPVGSMQTLKTQKDRSGKFGRVLGEFLLPGNSKLSDDIGLNTMTTLNELMVYHKVAVKYHGQSKDDVEEEHIKNRELVENLVNTFEKDFGKNNE